MQRWVVSSLKEELEEVGAQFRELPPVAFDKAAEYEFEEFEPADSLYDCFRTLDEENVFEALRWLCDEGIKHKTAISFQ